MAYATCKRGDNWHSSFVPPDPHTQQHQHQHHYYYFIFVRFLPERKKSISFVSAGPAKEREKQTRPTVRGFGFLCAEFSLTISLSAAAMEGGTPPPSPRVTRTSSLTSEDSLFRDSMSTEWTDEKHSLYLKSMEATFVNELYDSFDLLGWRSQREHSPDPEFPRTKQSNTRGSSGQYKVLRGGCWGKISFERHEPQLNKADGSGVLLANPWIRHFRSTCGHQIVTSSTLQEKAALGSLAVRVRGKMALASAALASNLKQLPAHQSNVCRYDSVGSNTEVTDQNFVDEDIEVETASHPCNAKRLKTSVVATSSNDQVVPFGKFRVTADVTSNSFSLEKERPRSSSDLKSENKDGFP